MGFINNMSIGKRLVSAFLALAGITLIISCWSVYSIHELSNKSIELYRVYGGAASDTGEIGMRFNEMRISLRDLIVEQNPTVAQNLLEELKQQDMQGNRSIDKLESKLRTSEEKRIFNDLKDKINQYIQIRSRVIALVNGGNIAEARLLVQNDGSILAKQIADDIVKMHDLAELGGNNLAQTNISEADQMIIIMGIVNLILIILASVLGVYISRSISEPLRQLIQTTDKLAAGNLNVSVDIKRADEVGQLAAAIAKMITNVSRAMHNIKAAAEQVAGGSKHVSDASITLSQGATEQASSVEQLSSSLVEIASQTKLNSDSANKANQLMAEAKHNADTGNVDMKEMLAAMTEINTASNSISKIIKVIDEIAFQTNILALNAAVEAARAGQHGKGFAVVAEEVRNLAARSAKAAKETTDMIEGSMAKVSDGTKIAYKTADTLEVIVAKVGEVAALMESITAASNEQSMALAQINQGVTQVSQVVQANSATSEEAAAASEELSAQAELLKQTVHKFKLSNEGYPQNDDFGSEISHYVAPQQNSNVPHIALSDEEFGKY